ncbi:MAG: YHS domain-containing (seleno)protein [Maricaulaceae bacterium]
MRVIKAAFLAAAALGFADLAFAGPQFVNKDNQALNGYDAVAYHTAGAPTKGSAEFTYDYNGATWLFASAENRDLFVTDPAKYAPAYDGHCAYGVAAGGRKFSGDPEVWTIEDGVLYVNVNQSIGERFLKDTAGYIETADQKWTGIEGEPAAKP